MSFVIPADTKISDIKYKFFTCMHCEELHTKVLQRTYFDSFDWRIYCAGGVIEEEIGTSGVSLRWRNVVPIETFGNISINKKIRFVWDLPVCSLRERLEPILDVRALLPLLCMNCQAHGLIVLNKDKKTVARLSIEENRILGSTKSKSLKLPAILYAESVKGYDTVFKEILQVIDQQLALEVDDQGMVQRAMAAVELQPASYSSNLNLLLSPETHIEVVMRNILLRLLEMMQVNERGIRSNLDSEFLHDFRIAVRRSRTALGQIKGVLPHKIWVRFSRKFEWLGEITGPTRDLDVYLLNFVAYKKSLPLPVRDDLDPFYYFLMKHQTIEHKKLVMHLESARYIKMTAAWLAYLKAPLSERTTLPNAHCSTLDVANSRIWHMVRRVVKEGEAISASSPPGDLHQLRKSCKKLRYLMDFFRSLYPTEEINKLINTLKLLQNKLGQYQDIHIQIASLETYRTQMKSESGAADRTLVAIDIVIQTLEQRQSHVRKMFKSRFAAFAEIKNRVAFRRLFKPKIQKDTLFQ
ncbi:CHAD domain-containing protein [Candidatus Nitrotoga sp. M5]|uniref:CHAD domain-containing protein n=1 Tax=Candidatus Nitrotoga sp. M5 TaxID=2890409 RepID=UPI001EF47CEF|nr:CHAD domain-containing protein [Candidatus Nitrotoga sp. M5]